MHISTNEFGFYGFEGVRSADFLLTITAMGYDTYNRKYFNNDTRALLNIPPIRLGVKFEELEEVTIERLRGPSVRGDTTEFWARDYIVRDYARLEDLLRRMEGITIDPDGSVYYNGEEVVRALFNNETYFTGSVKEAMKELPADIVERIQIIDRNIEGTGAREMKSEETVKVMNIVTKEDKAAGKMFNFTLEGGTQTRRKIDAFMRTIDGLSNSTDHNKNRGQRHQLSGTYHIGNTSGVGNLLYGNFTADYEHYDCLVHRHIDRSGLINSLEEEETDRQGRVFNYRLTADFRKDFTAKWSYHLMVVSSLDFDQGDEDMQTDVFSMRVPSWASDSSIHQRRNTQVGHFNNYAHNSLIWKVTPELKVQYISRISHSYQLRDIQAEKRVFNAKNGIISFVVMDLARQNAFTNYVSNEMGYTNTLSNMESRYFLLQFSWQPQFWGRSKHDPGQGRRGDGSFIQ